MQWIRSARWEIASFLLPVLVRLIYLFELSAHPGFESLMVDEKWHWLWAQDILERSFWGTEAYFRGPLYLYLLAAIHLVTDGSVFWSKLMLLGISGGTGLALFKLTSLVSTRTVAVVATVIYAFYGTFLFYDVMLLVESLFLLLTLGAICLLVRPNGLDVRSVIGAGVLFGLAALTRPNILIVLPIVAIWLWVRQGEVRNFARRLVKPVIFGAAVCATIAPVTLRNYLVTGDFLLISSQGGVNFYLGNNPSANGLNMLLPELTLTEAVPWNQFVPVTHAYAEKESGRELSEAEGSAFWNRKAWDYITSNPVSFLTLTAKKCWYLLSGFENSDNGDIYLQREQSGLYSLLVWQLGIFFPFGLLLPLAIAGAWLVRKEWRRWELIFLVGLAYLPSIILFLVTARHRLLIVLLLMPLAATTLVAAYQHFRRRSRASWGVPAILFVVALIACNIPYATRGPMDDFQHHYNEALRFQAAGDLAGANREYQTAASFYDGSSTLHNNYGYLQFLQGEMAGAEKSYRRSIALTPAFYQPYNNLGLLFDRKRQPDSAIFYFATALRLIDRQIETPGQVGTIHLNLAGAWTTLGLGDSALHNTHTAIQVAPDSLRILARAATIFAQLEQFSVSDSLYGRIRDKSALTPADLANWGLTYMARADFAPSIPLLREAYARDSSNIRALHHLAVAMHELSYPRDSVLKYVALTLGRRPDYEPALRLRELLEQR